MVLLGEAYYRVGQVEMSVQRLRQGLTLLGGDIPKSKFRQIPQILLWTLSNASIFSRLLQKEDFSQISKKSDTGLQTVSLDRVMAHR